MPVLLLELLKDIQPGTRLRGWVLECEMCGERFFGRNFNGKFCSNACRQAMHRQRTELSQEKT